MSGTMSGGVEEGLPGPPADPARRESLPYQRTYLGEHHGIAVLAVLMLLVLVLLLLLLMVR